MARLSEAQDHLMGRVFQLHAGRLGNFFAIGLPLSALTGIKPDYFGFAIASC
jgi:hypothetical protein